MDSRVKSRRPNSADGLSRVMDQDQVIAAAGTSFPSTNSRTQGDQDLMEELWESHKDTIYYHYVVDDIPLRVLIDAMKDNHDFHASKSQYERHFRKWGFHKNTKKGVWRGVGHRISKRTKQGKKSHVFLNGKLVRQETVRKETLRNRCVPTMRYKSPSIASSPELPKGVVVCTPGSWESDWPRRARLPWLRFASIFGRTDMPLESATRSDLRSYSRQETASIIFETTPNANCNLQVPTRLPEGLNSGLAQMISNIATGSQVMEVPKLAKRLNAIMPNTQVTEHYSIASEILGPNEQGAKLQFTKFAIYLLSNNLVEATGELQYTIIQWLRYGDNLSLFESLMSVQEPTIEAVKEAIFRIAILDQDVDIVKLVLNSGLNVNGQRIQSGTGLVTPLQSVCESGNLDIIHLLIKADANVNVPEDSFTWSPLTYAAHSADTEITNVLLSAGANIHHTNEDGETALHVAAREGDTKVIETLIGAGADIDATSWDDLTALDIAVQEYSATHPHHELLQDENPEGWSAPIHCILSHRPRKLKSALGFAVHAGDAKLVRELLATGMHVDTLVPLQFLDADEDLKKILETTALTKAAFCNNAELVKLFLEAKADVDGSQAHLEDSNRQITPLQAASLHESTGVVQLLLLYGADVNRTAHRDEFVDSLKTVGTALQTAAFKGNLVQCKIFLDVGADVNAPVGALGLTALQAAVHSQVTELVKILLEAGADVNPPASFWSGPTALQIAVGTCNHYLVNYLLSKGADVNAPAEPPYSSPCDIPQGMTALQAAVQSKSPQLVETLLEAGADINAPASPTALQIAIGTCNHYLVNYLLSKGADVNAPAVSSNCSPCDIPQGMTALQAAVQSKSPQLVETLLEAGANINAPASPGRGLTALQAAVGRGNHYLVNYLISKGADINAPAAPPLQSFFSASEGMTALTAAIYYGHQKLVSLLLKYGADINSLSPRTGTETALTAAVRRGNKDLVSLLLASGAKVDDSNALYAATQNTNTDLIHLLLWARTTYLNAPIKGYGSAALELAVRSGKCDLVRAFITSGIDVNEPVSIPTAQHTAGCYSHEPKHVLESAVWNGSPVITQILLDAGAHPDLILPERSMSVLQRASSQGRCDLVRKFLHAGADPNTPARGEWGRTALQAAAEKGSLDLVEVLLKAGADVNAPPCEMYGITALQGAAIGGFCGVVLKLLTAGADVNAAAAISHGRTAIEGASEHVRIDVLQLLLDNGAVIGGPGGAQYSQALSYAAREGHDAARRLLQSHHKDLCGND